MSMPQIHPFTALCLFMIVGAVFATRPASAAVINPEVIIYNETGSEMWFYEEADALPDKTTGNKVKSKKLGKGRAMVVNRNSLFKFKSKLAFYTNDYSGRKCTASGKTKFRHMNFGRWEYRKANSAEKKSYQDNYDTFKKAEKEACKQHGDASMFCMIQKNLTASAKDSLDDASKSDWRSTHEGKACVDNRYSKACLVVVAYKDKIVAYEDKGNFWGDACDKQKWKDFKYAASELKKQIEKSSPIGAAVVQAGEAVAEDITGLFNKLVKVLDGVTESACNKALDNLAKTLKPKSTSKYLDTSCKEETFKGFACAAPMYFEEIKKAPDNLKNTIHRLSKHKDCKKQKTIPKAVCSVFKVVQSEVKRPIACMKEMTENPVLRELFRRQKSSGQKVGKLSVPEEACYIAGQAAFVKAVDKAGIKISKKKKADRIKKLAKAFVKVRKAQKNKEKLDKKADQIKEEDIIKEFTKKKMPNCYDML